MFKKPGKAMKNLVMLLMLVAVFTFTLTACQQSDNEEQDIKSAASPYLSLEQVTAMLVEKGFYDREKNKNGTGITHQYEPKTINGETIVIDHTTGLTWQQRGRESINYEGAKSYVIRLNKEGYGGFHDWRLPTLEEAMSLMEPVKNEDNQLFIDPTFDSAQRFIWTVDKPHAPGVWVVGFAGGSCYGFHVSTRLYVRAVR